MATYKRAAQAKDLIERAARINNQLVNSLGAANDMFATLAGLPAAARTEVQAAITDMGYDPAEIQAMLTSWNVVHAAMVAEGLVKVDQ